MNAGHAPYSKVLRVRYHVQDDDCFCGAAAAMMILRSVGEPYRPQTDLFNEIYNDDPGWSGKIPGSSPKGLAEALQYFADPARRLRFTVRNFARQEDVIKRLIELLYADHAVAPALLISKCGHWLVVTGFQTDVEPTEGTDFTVLGFFINNPWFRTPNFVHSDNDPCGTKNLGVQDEWTSLSSLLATLTACPKQPPSTPFALVEATPPKSVGTMSLRSRLAYREDGTAKPTSLWTDASFDSAAVRNSALEQLERCGLDGSALFPGTGTIRAGNPVLVQRLDLLDSYYALIPLARNLERIGYARLDMHDRSLLGACASSSELMPTAKGAEKALLSASSECAETTGPPRPGTYVLHPTLVWRPCRESTSPYAPFRQISVAGRVVYYGSDRTLRRSLTPLEA